MNSVPKFGGAEDRGHLTKMVIPAMSETIEEGSVLDCMFPRLYGEKEAYLSFQSEFPGNLDRFISQTCDVYNNLARTVPRQDLIVSPDHLVPGAIVCVYHEDEWKRAVVVPYSEVPATIPSKELDKSFPGPWLRTLDIGEYVKAWRSQVFYLHPDLATKPIFSIRARLDFSRFCDHGGDLPKGPEWDFMVCRQILKIVYNKAIRVQFNKKEEKEGELIWNVSLLRLKDDPEGIGSIEAEAIRRALRKFRPDPVDTRVSGTAAE